MITNNGFNCVRLPFSVELFQKNPYPPKYTLLAEPTLQGRRAIEIFDYIVGNLTEQNLFVILDNHMSDGDWCCTENDGNGLWYTNSFTEDQWLSVLTTVTTRYKNNLSVIGFDIRNELRSSIVNGNRIVPTWGDNIIASDWRIAAEKAGNKVLKINPNLLIFVEGPSFSTDLTQVLNYPIHFIVPNKLVYSPHLYSWDYPEFENYEQLELLLDEKWGFIFKKNKYPVWVGEFGTCHKDAKCFEKWWAFFLKYLKINDLSWAYWPWDGTQSNGTGRKFGDEEGFGIVNMTWDGVANEKLLMDLSTIQ